MHRYLKTHWKLAATIWLITLCLPVFYHQARGAVKGEWIFVVELYVGFFLTLLPAVFKHSFVETLPFSTIFLIMMAVALLAHVFMCSYLAHFLARKTWSRRLLRRLIDDVG
jgi:hypothetical protein